MSIHRRNDPPMRDVSDEALEQAARLFRAVADVSRLRVLAILESRERCVSELAEELGVGISTVSQQLKVLRTERLITGRRDGTHIYYGLADRHIVQLMRSVLQHTAESDDEGRGAGGAGSPRARR